MRLLLFLLISGFALACGHVTSVRPTPKDTLRVEAALGGPLVAVPGVAVLPVPLSTAGARYGLGERYDVAAHVHLTSLTFGVAGLDVGSTWLALRQRRALPALSVSGRLYGFASLRAFAPSAYLELTGSASYLVGERYLSYVSVTGLAQLASGLPLLSVAAGEEVRLGRFGIQGELRWYEPNVATRYEVVRWLPLAGQGGLGIVLGLSYRFGG